MPKLDADDKTLLSRRVANDEPELIKLIGDVLALANGDPVTWAIDMAGGEPTLLALLIARGQDVLYMPGCLVNRAADGHAPGPGAGHRSDPAAAARSSGAGGRASWP